MNNFSPNMIKTYQTCPKKYYFQYVENINVPKSAIPFEKGKKIHALANYYLQKIKIDRIETALNGTEREVWKLLKQNPFYNMDYLKSEFTLMIKLQNLPPERGKCPTGQRGLNKGIRIYPYIKEFSREIRKNMTPQELKMWNYIRKEQLGIKFRRQHPINNKYIADFACPERKIIIEIDGSQHIESDDDKYRTFYIENTGYQIVRFYNNDIDTNIEGCIEYLQNVIKQQPPTAVGDFPLLGGRNPEGLGNNLYWVSGRLDALVYTDGNYYILDYKTGSIPKNPEFDPQTMIYLLCADRYLKNYDTLSFVYIDLKNKQNYVIKFTPELKTKYEQKLNQICGKITSDSLYKCNISSCKYCEFNKICNK